MNEIHYIYQIKDKATDKVLYVGESIDPTRRWKRHTQPSGKFSLQLHYMHVLENEWVFDNKKDARYYENIMQEHCGLKTEKEKRRERIADLISPKNKRGGWKARHKSGIASSTVQYECPHCHKKGVGRVMKRWHFDNCSNLTGLKRVWAPKKNKYEEA